MTAPAGREHFWYGEWIDDAEAARRLERHEHAWDGALPELVDPDVVVDTCDRVAAKMAASSGGLPEELAGFLRADQLRRTVRAELGELPRARRRLAASVPAESVVEAWEPLGLLAHIAPSNTDIAGAVTLVEGLLTGNVNIVKTSERRDVLTQRFAAELVAAEPGLAPHVAVLRFGSRRRSWTRWMCEPADGVVVWGGDEAVASAAALVAPGARLIAWGPRISFAYLSALASRDRAVLTALAGDVCANDQAACTSPQIVYVDTDRDSELWAAAERVADALSAVDQGLGPPRPNLQEQAEITNTILVARQEEHLGVTRVWSGPDGRWHVVAELDPAVRASPLFRTVWVKPLPQATIVRTLRPARRYLQTVGVHAPRSPGAPAAPPDLVEALLAAGADRITPVGSMHQSYPGEPHDGQYALRRYSRRVTVRYEAQVTEIS